MYSNISEVPEGLFFGGGGVKGELNENLIMVLSEMPSSPAKGLYNQMSETKGIIYQQNGKDSVFQQLLGAQMNRVLPRPLQALFQFHDTKRLPMKPFSQEGGLPVLPARLPTLRGP